MAGWRDCFKDFESSEDDRQFCAKRKKDGLTDIDATDIIEILDNIAGDENNRNNKIEVLKIEHCRIKDDLDIWNLSARSNLKRFEENGLQYIQFPNIILKFSSTVFEGKFSFKHVRFKGKFSFKHVKFRGVTYFNGARFAKSTEFDNAQFGEQANFTGARFRGQANFMGVRFGEQANFMGAQFEEKSDFMGGTRFRINADFRKSRFGEKAIFIRARFRGVTDFGEARFRGETDFAMARFGKETHFDSVQFGEKTNFNGARFKFPANFTNVKYWSDFVRVTWARWLWKDKLFSIDLKFQNSLDNCSSILDLDAELRREFEKKFKKNGISFSDATISIDKTDSKWLIIDTENKKTYHVKKEKEKLNIYGDSSRNKKIRKVLLLPENSPESEPPEPAQFKLDSQNIDEVTNPHFKRYVADQQYIRAFQDNHSAIHRLWRRTSNCGRSLSLWAFWCLLIALFFGFAYVHQYLISGAFLAISGICLLDDFRGKKRWIFLPIGLIGLLLILSVLDFKIKGIGFKDEILLLLFILSLYFQVWYCVWRRSSNRVSSISSWIFVFMPLTIIVFLLTLAYISSPGWMPNWWCDFWQEPEFQQTAAAYKGKPLNFWSSFYFSIVTFTTLGFGDVVAANPFARFLVTLEVILGYVMLGGLISIFANKLARRS